MTRFIYIADTHCGAQIMGFHQQPAYPQSLEKIIAALNRYISEDEAIDFVIHGGDMADSATVENIKSADALFQSSVPIYLCLGNHDLTDINAVDMWMNNAPEFFIGKQPDYCIDTDDVALHILPNQWCDQNYYWTTVQSPHFAEEQIDQLYRAIREREAQPQIVVTHSPIFGAPAEQTGLGRPFHSPDVSFTEAARTLAEDHECVKCFLGAHNHLNTNICSDGVHYATVSSLVESPFELKLFECTSESIVMKTLSLRQYLDFDSDYNTSKSYVQGRDIDREFRIVL